MAEAIGTAMLMLAVVGSGIQSNIQEAASSSATMTSAVAISASLVGLILALGSVSGGHFNPTITILQWVLGQRQFHCTTAYVVAQVVGAIVGALIASAIFAAPIGLSNFAPPDVASVASEAVATFGLMVIVFCSTRSTNKSIGPFAVGLWLTAAILATPTGSLANPAVTMGLLATPKSVSIVAVALFVASQMIGGALAVAVVSFLYPATDTH
jgi:glycerol uptake facilitator-like aquaporin